MSVNRRRRAAQISAVVAAVLGVLRAGHLAAQPPASVSVHAESEVGIASWYGKREAGRATASGDIFNPSLPTAAHRHLPFGTCVQVTRLGGGASIVVPINDRGPYKPGRLIDLSEAAADALDMKAEGLVRVRLDVLPSCPPTELSTPGESEVTDRTTLAAVAPMSGP